MSDQGPFARLTRYTFGTTSLGRSLERLDEDVRLVRRVMEAGVSIHTNSLYGLPLGAFMVLRLAFDEAPAQAPPVILKVRCQTPRVLRFDIEDAIRRLGIDRVDVAQLSNKPDGRAPILRDLLEQGPLWTLSRELEDEGKVGTFALSIGGPTPAGTIEILRATRFGLFVFDCNLFERRIDNDVALAVEQVGGKVLALRTLAAGLFDPDKADQRRQADPTGYWAHLAARRVALEPLFHRSGCTNWVEFAVRFILSVPGVLTTIGSTSRLDHLVELLEAGDGFRLLDEGLVGCIRALHTSWSHRLA